METRWTKSLLIQFSLAVLLILSTAPCALWAADGEGGASDGGGGGVILLNDQYILSDFFNLEKLPSDVYGVEKVPSTFESAMSSSKSLAESWMSLPLDLIGIRLYAALKGPIVWSFTQKAFQVPAMYRAQQLPKNTEMIPVAFYQMGKGQNIVRLYSPIWTQMSLKNKTGILVHEAFRQVQIAYDVGFNDETLQKATAIFMTCKASVKLDQYLNLLMMNEMEYATQKFGSYEKLTESCGSLK